jgi:hypothetical protein
VHLHIASITAASVIASSTEDLPDGCVSPVQALIRDKHVVSLKLVAVIYAETREVDI